MSSSWDRGWGAARMESHLGFLSVRTRLGCLRCSPGRTPRDPRCHEQSEPGKALVHCLAGLGTWARLWGTALPEARSRTGEVGREAIEGGAAAIPLPNLATCDSSERTLWSEEARGVDSGDVWPRLESSNSGLSAPNPCQLSGRGAGFADYAKGRLCAPVADCAICVSVPGSVPG